jgi:hypothetical protein
VATRIESAQLRHREIRNHYIGSQRARRFEKSAAVTDTTDDVVRGLEQASPRREQSGVVIREQYTRSMILSH